jgi:hypothetical protein
LCGDSSLARVQAERERTAWREPPHTPEEAPRRRGIPEHQVVEERSDIESQGKVPALEERLGLRGKGKKGRCVTVIERLYAKAIAGEEEHLLAQVHDAEGEHAVEALDTVRSPFLVRVQDDLRVASRAESMPFAGEFIPQGQKVVDLPVVGNP